MTTAVDDSAICAGDHLVAFYDTEAELGRTVGRYLHEALRDGAVAVAIATPEHRQAFESELESAGLRPGELAAQERLVWLDAERTLGGIVAGAVVADDAFRRIVGGVMHRAAASGRPVRAYGEMVALLWEAGEVLGAVELERLWNELGRELRFSLLCTYPHTSAFAPEHASALHEVCHLHTSVLAAEPGEAADRPAEIFATRRYPATPDSPAAARRLVGAVLAEGGHGGSPLQDAVLVVSELATNALIHARSPFSVAVRSEGEHLRLSVHDWSKAEPRLRASDSAAVSGRGLQLVAAVCDRWGVERGPDGKTVWAELRLAS